MTGKTAVSGGAEQGHYGGANKASPPFVGGGPVVDWWVGWPMVEGGGRLDELPGIGAGSTRA
jgi:hypothetical protein